jgi:hypothetical protein
VQDGEFAGMRIHLMLDFPDGGSVARANSSMQQQSYQSSDGGPPKNHM